MSKDIDKDDDRTDLDDYIIMYRELEERIESLEDTIGKMRREISVIKKVLRNEISRYEVKLIKQGEDVDSILD